MPSRHRKSTILADLPAFIKSESEISFYDFAFDPPRKTNFVSKDRSSEESKSWLVVFKTLLFAHRLNHGEGFSKSNTPYRLTQLSIPNLVIHPDTLNVFPSSTKKIRKKTDKADQADKEELFYNAELMLGQGIRHIGDLINPFIGRYRIQGIKLDGQDEKIAELKSQFKYYPVWAHLKQTLYWYIKEEDIIKTTCHVTREDIIETKQNLQSSPVILGPIHHLNKIHYLLPLPNGGFIESSIDLKKEGFTLPLKYDEAIGEPRWTMSSDAFYKKDPKQEEAIKKFHAEIEAKLAEKEGADPSDWPANPFKEKTPAEQQEEKEEERFNTLLQNTIDTAIQNHATRQIPSFFKKLYDPECYESKAYKKILEEKSLLELAKISLLTALGIDQSVYDYQQTSQLLESDFLYIFSKQYYSLDRIYCEFPSPQEALKDPMVQAIHSAMFASLNTESFDITKALANIEKKNTGMFKHNEQAIEAILKSLSELRAKKKIKSSSSKETLAKESTVTLCDYTCDNREEIDSQTAWLLSFRALLCIHRVNTDKSGDPDTVLTYYPNEPVVLIDKETLEVSLLDGELQRFPRSIQNGNDCKSILFHEVFPLLEPFLKNKKNFFADLYHDNSRTWTPDKEDLFQSKGTLEMARLALIEALGIDQNLYHYDPSSLLNEDDFLEILANEVKKLSSIRKLVDNVSGSQSFMKAVHESLFGILNDEETHKQWLNKIESSHTYHFNKAKAAITSLWDSMRLAMKDKKIPISETSSKEETQSTSKEQAATPPNNDFTPTPQQKPNMNKSTHVMCWSAVALGAAGVALSSAGFVELSVAASTLSLTSQYALAVVGLCLIAAAIGFSVSASTHRNKQLKKSGWFEQQKKLCGSESTPSQTPNND